MKSFILLVGIILISKCSGGAVKRKIDTWSMDRNPKPFVVKEKQPSEIEKIRSKQEDHAIIIQKLNEDMEKLKETNDKRK